MESTFDRSFANGILPDKLDKYMKEFESDVLLNEVNIHDKTLLRASLAAKWCRYEYEEKRYRDEMTSKLDKLKEEAKMKLFEKKRAAIENRTMNQSMINIEAERIIKESSIYLKIKDELNNEEDVLRFIAEAKQIISQFGFDIKNAIEILKLEN